MASPCSHSPSCATDPGSVARAFEAGEHVVFTRRGEVAARAASLLGPVRPSEVLRDRALEVVRLAIGQGLTADVRVIGPIATGEDRPGDPVDLLVEIDRERQDVNWPTAFISRAAELLDLDVRVVWIGSPIEKAARLLDGSQMLLSWAGITSGDPAEFT